MLELKLLVNIIFNKRNDKKKQQENDKGNKFLAVSHNALTEKQKIKTF